MRKMINKINWAWLKFGMKINVKKTKVMKFSKNIKVKVKITIDNEEIENIEDFRYLRAFVSDDGKIKKQNRHGKKRF